MLTGSRRATLAGAVICWVAAPVAAQSSPEVMRTPPPPASPSAPDRARSDATPVETDASDPRAEFAVRILGQGRELWSGVLRLENFYGAAVDLELQQAGTVCADDIARRFRNRRHGLKFELRYYTNRQDGPFTVKASWVRKSDDCALPGVRTVGLETAMDIAVGERRLIEADGGFQIELTRRF